MCTAGWPVLLVLLRIVTASPSRPDEGDDIKRCLESGQTVSCLEGMAADLVDNAVVPDTLRILPGLQLLRTNRTARGMADVTNRTLSFDILKVADGLGKGEGGRGKKRRRLMLALIMTALIAAKAAAVATSTSIMVPLALKGITLLALKALLIGKIAVFVASAFGFLRLISGPTSSTTEVIYDHKQQQKRVDHREPYIPPGYKLLRKEPEFTGSGVHQLGLSLAGQKLPPPLLFNRPESNSLTRDRRR